MPEYIEIEDAKEIRRLNCVLSETLKDKLLPPSFRILGDAHQSYTVEVRFVRDAFDADSNLLYWSNPASKGKKKKLLNFFGHGKATDKTALNIDVMCNFLEEGFSRNFGGAFLLHTPSGEFALAHRGKMTKGKSAVPKGKLFAEMARWGQDATTGGKATKFLVIGHLESPTLVNEIDAFSSAVRRIKNDIP